MIEFFEYVCMTSLYVEQLFVVVNTTFSKLQWNVNTYNNIVTFKRQGSSLITLPDGTTNISIIGLVIIIFTISTIMTLVNTFYTIPMD